MPSCSWIWCDSSHCPLHQETLGVCKRSRRVWFVPLYLHYCLYIGELPLHRACRFGKLAIVKELVGVTTNINHRDRKGETALCIAAKTGKKEITQLLILKGANPLIRNNNGDSTLDVVEKSDKSHIDVIRILSAYVDRYLPTQVEVLEVEEEEEEEILPTFYKREIWKGKSNQHYTSVHILFVGL